MSGRGWYALLCAATLCMLLVPVRGSAQPAYAPTRWQPSPGDTVRLVMLFVGSPDAMSSNDEALAAALEGAKHAVCDHAESAGIGVTVVGFAAGGDIAAGFAYLTGTMGGWDEVHVGGGWTNQLAAALLFPQEAVPPPPLAALPQVLVYRQVVRPAANGLEFGPMRIVTRLPGASRIKQWAAAGAPLGDSWQARR